MINVFLATTPFSVGSVGGVLGPKLQDSNSTAANFLTAINNIVAAITTIAGLALFAMLVMGGFQYITAGGDEKALGRAKNQIMHALVGFLILILAWWGVRILSVIFGINLLKPVFPGPP